jgi:DNA-binding PadR family transcriptional regulator
VHLVLELAVLGLLKEQPLHGYELKKRLGETLGSLWGVSYGSLYPALRRLERSGAIEIVEPTAGPVVASVPTGSVKGDLAAARLRAVADRLSSSGRRTRKAYRLTERGEALFSELMLGDDDRGDDEREFALKLAFCGHLPPPARLQLLERRRDALRAGLAPVRRSRSARGTGRAPDRYLTALVEHRTRAIQRDLEWVEGLIELERGDAVARTDNDHTIEQGATA